MATRWSASAASSAGSPTPRCRTARRSGRPAVAGVVQVDLARAVGGQHGQPGGLGGARPRPPGRARPRRAGGTGCRRWRGRSWGCRGRPSCPASTTASAPAASAVRMTVPALPGSRTSAQMATSRARRPQRRRASGTSRKRQTATMPAGVTLSLSEARARSSTSVTARRRRSQGGVLLGGGGRGEDLDDAPGDRQRALDGLRAVGKEQPPLGANRAAAELAGLLDPGVPGGQGSACGRGRAHELRRRPWAR